jgi:hypothetical protein
MNTNENSSKADPRMLRIQKFSAALRTIFRVTAVLVAVGGLFQLYGALSQLHRLNGSIHWHFIIANAVTDPIWAVGLWLCGNLFMYYSRGDLFSAKVVSCIRQIGYVVILKGVVSCISTFTFMFENPPSGFLGVLAMAVPAMLLGMLLGTVPGVALICGAWVMDEGRKMREEQELTV